MLNPQDLALQSIGRLRLVSLRRCGFHKPYYFFFLSDSFHRLGVSWLTFGAFQPIRVQSSKFARRSPEHASNPSIGSLGRIEGLPEAHFQVLQPSLWVMAVNKSAQEA